MRRRRGNPPGAAGAGRRKGRARTGQASGAGSVRRGGLRHSAPPSLGYDAGAPLRDRAVDRDRPAMNGGETVLAFPGRPDGRAARRRRGRARSGYANGFPRSSKYLRVTLNTIGASSRSPMRLGTAMSPLRVSDRFHTRSTFTFAKESAASTHNAR